MATAVSIPFSLGGYPLRPSEVEVPVEEYLVTSYDPDMDYLDGHLEERNLGDWDHSELQSALLTFLRNHGREWGIHAVAECRLQVRRDRFRVPDIMVVPREHKPSRIVRQPPVLCIEVLSPDDTFRRIQSRVDDYVEMGVKNIWVLSPLDGRVFTVANGHQQFVEERILTVEGTAIRLNLDEIKAELAD
jgi:Uma2 family endonuclease